MATPVRQMTRRLRDPAQVDLAPLEQHPRFRAMREELSAIERRIAEAEHRQAVARARARGQQPTRPVEQRAEDLVGGGRVVVMPPAAESEAAEEELRILHAARCAKNEQLQALRSEISFEACRRFAPAHAEALRAALDASRQLHEALEVARTIRGRLAGAGYGLNDAALPVHMFPAGAAVGDPERFGTPAARFKSWLRERGII